MGSSLKKCHADGPLCDTRHNTSHLSSNVSHPEFCPAASYFSPDASHPGSVRHHPTFSGCLSSGICLPSFLPFSGCLSSGICPSTFRLIRMSLFRDMSGAIPPSPDVSHPESIRRHSYLSPNVSHSESVRRHSTLSGCLSSGICPPTSPFLRMSHIRNSIRPKSHLLWMSHIRRLTPDGKGGRFNFPRQACSDPRFITSFFKPFQSILSFILRIFKITQESHF